MTLFSFDLMPFTGRCLSEKLQIVSGETEAMAWTCGKLPPLKFFITSKAIHIIYMCEESCTSHGYFTLQYQRIKENQIPYDFITIFLG